MPEKKYVRVSLYLLKSQKAWVKEQAKKYAWPNNNLNYVIRKIVFGSNWDGKQAKGSETIGQP